MKKYMIVLAATAFALAACNKNTTETPSPYSSVKVNLTVSMPDPVTKANFELTTADNPVGGMTVTWQEGDVLTLIIFQGDNANWQDNFIYKEIQLPAAAEGQTSVDLSTVMPTLDLSGFDSEKNLKYVVVLGGGFNDYWKEFNIWNGIPYIIPSHSITQQINGMGMIAETDVQEVAFPTGDLTLKGSLHWITSVLAVQFDIDSEADITYESESIFIFYLNGNSYPDCYTPITKSSDTSALFDCPIHFPSAGKLSDALDANKCRYFTIPADGMTTDAAKKIGGSSINVRMKRGVSETYYTASGSIGDVTIEGGKVYGIKVKVTDSDSDGEPEFTKQ